MRIGVFLLVVLLIAVAPEAAVAACRAAVNALLEVMDGLLNGGGGL